MMDDDLPPAFPKTERLRQQRKLPLWLLIAVQVSGLLLIAALLAWWLLRPSHKAAPLPPTATPAPTEEAALVLPTMTLPPTALVLPTPTSPPMTPTPTPPPPTPTVPPPPADPAGDVVQLVGQAAVSAPPDGVDVAGCSIERDATVRLDVPPPFGAPSEGAFQLWLTMETPLPESRTLDYHFLVALDVDGSQATGRPVGDGYINPDIGEDVGAGYILHPDGSADLYLYIWSPTIGGWQEVADAAVIVHAEMNENRNAIVFTFDRAALTQQVEAIAGFAPDFTAMRGRMGIIASSQTEAAIVDFCPDLP